MLLLPSKPLVGFSFNAIFCNVSIVEAALASELAHAVPDKVSKAETFEALPGKSEVSVRSVGPLLNWILISILCLDIQTMGVGLFFMSICSSFCLSKGEILCRVIHPMANILCTTRNRGVNV